MDAKQAVEFAFEEGLDVRGADAARTARVSLALHASRTVDASPFLARDKDFAARARAALEDEGRPALVLQVAMWESDSAGGAAYLAGGPVDRALGAYGKAKAWAAGEAGEANLAWIRDVPRAPAEREALAQRLLLRAEARGAPRERLAAAALEAELAELPQPSSFATVLRAAAGAGTPTAAARTLEGLSALDPAADSPEARTLLLRLRVSLEIVRQAAQGAALEAVLEQQLAALGPASAPAVAVVIGHLAASAARAGRADLAASALDRAQKAVEEASPTPRDALASLLFMKRAVAGDVAADPFGLPPTERPAAAELVAGACDASRAMRSAAPALQALRLFDPEDVGFVLPGQGPGGLVKELVREGSRAAAAAGDVAALAALLERVRRMSLRPQWDVFLRAILADASAEAAARHGSAQAWDLALKAGGRPLPRFERAKMRGRAACEFVRASESEAGPALWVDPYFPAAPRTAGSSADP